jgi:hypothetical protein
MPDYKYFDKTGKEIFPKTVGELTHVTQVGGSPEKTIVILYVESEKLDRTNVSELLNVEPDEAWDPGEKHPYGSPNLGYFRSANWGRWKLQSIKDDSNIESKITSLLQKCSNNLENWRILSSKFEICLTIVGYFNNWNREFFLSNQLINEINKRKLNLKFDVYFLEIKLKNKVSMN